MQKKTIIIAVLFIGGLIGLVNAFLPESGASQTPEKQQSAGKTFELKNLEGETISLEDYRGKVVLVNFWATWCPPCIKEIPDIVKLRNTYKDKNFEVIGIIVNSKEPQVKKMVQDFNISYPVLWADTQVINDFGPIRAIPRTFILDKEGRIVEDIEGMSHYANFEAMIKKYL